MSDGELITGASCRIGGEWAPAYHVLGEVAVGLDPEGVIAHPETGLVYVSCSRSNAVAVVDPESLEVVGMIPVGDEPIDIVHDTSTNRIFTADARSDQVSVIDPDSAKVIGTIEVGAYPSGLCIDVEGRRLYCGDSAGSTMSVIDLDRLERIATVEAELGAGAIAADPKRDRVYCVNFIGSSLTVVEASTLRTLARIPLPDGPCAIGVERPGGDVFIADSLSCTVTRISGAGDGERVAALPVPNAPVGLIVGSGDDRLYVANRGDGTVSVLGLDGLEWARIPVGFAPGGVSEHPAIPGRLLVANAGSGTITVVDDLLPGPPDFPAEDVEHPLVGTKLPELMLPDLRTRQLRRLGAQPGQRYIFNVFASW